MGTTTFSEDADLAADLLATAGLGGATGVGALAALAVVFATGLETGFTTAFAVGLEAVVGLEAALATGLIMDFFAALATGLGDLTADFTGFLTTGLALAAAFTTGFTAAFFATLATFTGFARGLASFFVLVEAAFDLGSFPDLAFTWSLLVELARLSPKTLWASADVFDGLL